MRPEVLLERAGLKTTKLWRIQCCLDRTKKVSAVDRACLDEARGMVKGIRVASTIGCTWTSTTLVARALDISVREDRGAVSYGDTYVALRQALEPS